MAWKTRVFDPRKAPAELGLGRFTRRHTASARIVESGHSQVCKSYWSEGSKDEFWMLTRVGSHGWAVSHTGGRPTFPSFSTDHIKPSVVDDDHILVEGGTFRGKPSHLALWLTEKTWNELGLQQIGDEK